MLMASAGYDPEVAPDVYKKKYEGYGKFNNIGILSEYFPGEKRARVSPYSNPGQKISSGLNLIKPPQAPSPPFLTRSFHVVSSAPGPGVGFQVGVARRILHPNPDPKYGLFAGAGTRRVPYSNKFHYTLSHNLENKYIENGFVKWCAGECEGYIENERKLPPSDPHSIKVKSIAKTLLEAMREGLMLQNKIEFVEPTSKPVNRRMEAETLRFTEAEYLSNSMDVKRQINRRRRFIWKPFTKHLDGKVWEVYATDNYSKYKHKSDEFEQCLLHKVVIDAKTLRNLKSDEEYATVIAHKIGHIIARHQGENFLNTLFGISYVFLAFLSYINLLLPVLLLVIVPSRYLYLLEPVFNFYDGPTFYIFCLRMCITLPILGAVASFLDRRMEADADYIGLMLMASAGYDPEVAPHVYEKLLNKKDSIFRSSGENRAKLLRKPKTMKLAKQVYEEVKAGYGVRNFA
ncbi:Peptidase M48 [Corchorus capsularis]|uniref:Peptidase M48 n=1 Tax=Corchorus capsularis TaxID=210143 RepID=A0A1R3I7Q9_COCAP|nr:Peptidase M48 [Corchorus capsularis]